ncbi:hypothetical protein QBC39DRAFT_350485 [Podospora conica]|nr:hypothetical protein QBC39DRAFT_350485 [Schizothecium conicum]
MKVVASLVTLALAAGAIAQSMPDCAKPCVDKLMINGVGDCGTDPKCICADKSFLGSISCCVLDECDTAGQNSAIVFAADFCSRAGVTGLPTTVACATAGATGAPTGTAGQTTAAATTPPTGAGAGTAPSTSTNFGPRQTAAGLGAIGGIVAVVAML